ncbi:UDP-N-acetylglucosamine--N-acetylmuramyl-(pentapeptide) pyrophosphoryl-undecaprenol N-acetylglucosamine transferase [Candidatus Beckwithbacteria bacterium]|nr:UDP-N-acetylglucosamine--N-acetylmuramyl-(pentapeptide) pyrophosphoryl-undecaprenol N-acetylglucosamine transferase [Candidatus Beckwithbacteria bacterium]
MSKTIIFSGGHHNSALLIAQDLKAKGYNVIWFGHKYSMKGDTHPSQEFQDIQAAGIAFIELKAGKIYRGNILALFKTIWATFYSLYYFIAVARPSLVFTFGGYLAVPVALAAWILGIPVFGYEHTCVLGKANSFLLPFFKKLYLVWPNPNLQKNSKTKLIGMPIKVQNQKKAAILQNFNTSNKPLLLIVGGKQGSHFINNLINQSLEKLLLNYKLIHITGANSKTRDFERQLLVREKLDPQKQSSYQVLAYSQEFNSLMKTADLIIGRSGAHTVYEILTLEKKLLAIPLPFGSGNEQEKNAQLLVSLGLAQILPQKETDTKSLLMAIKKTISIKKDVDKINKFKKEITNSDPMKIITNDISTILS